LQDVPSDRVAGSIFVTDGQEIGRAHV